MVEMARSADGVEIAFEIEGEGPPIVIVGGALMNRASTARMNALLATDYAVFSYDRRGRGDSGDSPSYSVEREFEDLEAVLAAAGGSPAVFGMSSGAFIALETAARGSAVSTLIVYEPPYLTGHGESQLSAADYGRRLNDVLEAGHPDQAVELFLRQISGGWFDEGIKSAPWWPGMVALGSSLRYDAALTGEGDVPDERLAKITVPTFAMYGGNSSDWAKTSAEAIVNSVPDAQPILVPGQNHQPDEAVLASALRGVLDR